MKKYNSNWPAHKLDDLEKARNIWTRATTHPSGVAWRSSCIEYYRFYDGSGQWLDEDINKLAQRGQRPLVMNIVQSLIDSLSGVEIQSRFRLACRNDSANDKNDKLAAALTHLLYFIQRDQQMPYKASLKFRDMLIGGIGWSNIYYESGRYYYDYVNPFNIIPDMDDLTPQFEDMKYVCRKRWMDPAAINLKWPFVSDYLGGKPDLIFPSSYSPEVMDRQELLSSPMNSSGGGYGQARVMVGEVQFKEPAKGLRGIDYNGNYFETFDLQLAEELANENDIEEFDTSKIKRVLFLDELLLESSALKPSLPGSADFTYIPVVAKRYYMNGAPYGLVASMTDLQRDINVRKTREMFLANSKTLILTGSLPPGDSIEDLSEKLKRPDSVIALSPETKYELRENAPLVDTQIKILQEDERMMQRVTGIYDDLQGRQTNASSGVAQRQRQLNSIRNSVGLMDNFASMREREGRLILSLIQGSANENLMASIFTQEQKETIVMNLHTVVWGKKVVLNDIRTLPLSLYIEEVPDFNSSFEENRQQLENLLSNPNAPLIMRSRSMMKQLGVRDYEKIAYELEQIMGANQNNELQPQGENIGGVAADQAQIQAAAFPNLGRDKASAQ